MSGKHTLEELNQLSREELVTVILTMQGQLDALNENIERLIEQVRLASQHRFGRKTETMQSIEGQLSFFNEAEAFYDKEAKEPEADDVLPRKPRRKKAKGQRDTDLKEFPEDIIPPHAVSKETPDAFHGPGCWRRMPDETYKRLRHEPESWTVEVHTVEVYVGTDGEHQDEFLRGDRPKDIFRNSIVTPSLLASILNVKYVNSAPLNRIEQEFGRNGVNISRQTMSNRIIHSSDRYFAPLVERMKQELLKLPVIQADETPTRVIHDGRHPGSKSYMWVHRSGEFCKDRPVVIYEYQKGREHELPLAFYQDYKGVLVTDGLQQYHLVEKKPEGLVNANCWAHARRDYADALKAADKSEPDAVRRSTAYQALSRISQIYKLEGALKDLSPKQRLQERQKNIKPLVEEYFAWVKK
ncbi:MAG: IS66 family transposase [Acetatifactor sp.]|nr:IS66 family transposase [Acetatifactor sp.]